MRNQALSLTLTGTASFQGDPNHPSGSMRAPNFVGIYSPRHYKGPPPMQPGTVRCNSASGGVILLQQAGTRGPEIVMPSNSWTVRVRSRLNLCAKLLYRASVVEPSYADPLYAEPSYAEPSCRASVRKASCKASCRVSRRASCRASRRASCRASCRASRRASVRKALRGALRRASCRASV